MDGSEGSFRVPAAATPLDVLEDEITELSAHIQAATSRLLALIAEFDRREGWAGPGLRSCAHWLNWKCGIDLGAAREKVRVARALAGLPLISASFTRGEVSYSKVRAMTRVATAENESELLHIARHGTAHHVERLVSGYRRARQLADVNLRHAERFVSWHTDDDGCLVIRGRLPADQGSLVLQALQATVDAVRERDRGQETSGKVAAETSGTPVDAASFGARRADALELLAETFIAKGPGELAGGERYQVVVHTGPDVAAETCRRLDCDCSRVHIKEDADGEPLNVGRKTRSIPTATMRALRARDHGCRFPGCTAERFVDGHHIRHWADGGETKLTNLVLLCRHHHRLVHEAGFGVRVLDDGALHFTRPDGQRLPVVDSSESAFAGDWRTLAAQHERRGLAINASTGVPLWGGEQMDFDAAIEGLLPGAFTSLDGACGNRFKQTAASRSSAS